MGGTGSDGRGEGEGGREGVGVGLRVGRVERVGSGELGGAGLRAGGREGGGDGEGVLMARVVGVIGDGGGVGTSGERGGWERMRVGGVRSKGAG